MTAIAISYGVSTSETMQRIHILIDKHFDRLMELGKRPRYRQMPPDKVEEAIALHQSGISAHGLARYYGVHPKTMRRLLIHETV
jgi:hypothetical protein